MVVEYFGRRAVDWDFVNALSAMAMIVVIPLLQDERNPADFGLYNDHFQSRVALKNAGPHHIVDTVDGIVGFYIDRSTDALKAGETRPVVGMSRQDMHVDRRVHVRGDSPKGVVM